MGGEKWKKNDIKGKEIIWEEEKEARWNTGKMRK